MKKLSPLATFAAILAVVWLLTTAGAPSLAGNATPHPGTVKIETPHPFNELWQRLEQAVKDNNMGIVARASASKGAAARGLTIAGNAVIGVYRNDFAVRMLEASVPAGIEAPFRYYVTENADGTASLTYRRPSAVFAPYDEPELDAMAAELDALFEAIAKQATQP